MQKPSLLMQETAERAQKLAHEKFNKRLDYSELSIQDLDKLLAEAKSQVTHLAEGGKEVDDIVSKTSKIWGAYFGELIRRLNGGKWIYSNGENVLETGIFEIVPDRLIKHIILHNDIWAADMYRRIRAGLDPLLPTSIPRLEMEIENLKDNRRLYEGKRIEPIGFRWSGILFLLSIYLFLFVSITWGIGFFVSALFSEVAHSRRADAVHDAEVEIERLDSEIKKLRYEIIEFEERTISTRQ